MPRVIFLKPDGTRHEVDAPVDTSLMELARDNGLDVEGACEGAMACSTCHVIVDAAWYDRLPEPTEDEEDMLDLAYGLTATSRLGCQIVVTQELDGLIVRLPDETHNMLI